MHGELELHVPREPGREVVGVGQLEEDAVAASGVVTPRVKHKSPRPPSTLPRDGGGEYTHVGLSG